MNIDKVIAEHLPEALALRHELHRIPELAGEERETSALLRKRLEKLPLKIFPPFLGTDVSALLGSPGTHPNLTLRADIDALPLEEKRPLDYASVHPGRMHACGHDGHTAMLYGALLSLIDLKENLNCSVRFLFQPGEEIRAMAKQLVEAGVLENPHADFIAGIHNWPHVPYGRISARTGAVMAAAGFFRITLTGKGGHGSMPALARNPLETAARIILETRKLVPEGCVLSFCACRGGSNSNVIPSVCGLEGTVRFLDEDAGRRMVSDFEQLCRKLCSEAGIQCDLVCDLPYPVTANSVRGYELARRTALEYLGPDGFAEMPRSSMSSEDFAYYLHETDGVFCHLGTGENGPALHSDFYDFDDSVLEKGMRFFVGLALNFGKTRV